MEATPEGTETARKSTLCFGEFLNFLCFSQGWGGGCVSSPLGGAEAPGNGEMEICHFWEF